MKMSLQLGALTDDVKDLQQLIRKIIIRSKRSVDGHLGFGDGVDADNMFGKWKAYTTNAAANTQDTIAHGLNMIPIGWLLFSIDKGGVLYRGATAWDVTNIYLKCTIDSANVLIFIVGPSTKDS
jgi:hypothetical protein